jgi:hypothetical protein
MNKHGLYSKAAQLIRQYGSERGTVDQMLAFAKKGGMKDAELQNAGVLPTGKIDREELAKIFEARIPAVRVDQYGENPQYLQGADRQRHREIGNRLGRGEEVSPEEREEYRRLHQRFHSGPNVMSTEDDDGNEDLMDTQYGGYTTDGGRNYRERLLKLDQREHPAKRAEANIASLQDRIWHQMPVYGEDHPIIQGYRKRLGELQAERDEAIRTFGQPRTREQQYQSSHWSDHPDVLAHIRMMDRTVGEDWPSLKPVAERLASGLGVSTKELASGAVSVGIQRGVITPEEGASLSRVLGWRNGYERARGVGKRLLHVEELQSDWAQEGRDKGFYDPDRPYQLYDFEKSKPISNHATEEEAMEEWKKHDPESTSLRRMNTGRPDMPPVGPYVGNTQHWTDLALKHVLREAAMGDYDGIVFTPGQAQADRYGLEKQLDVLHYDPSTQTLSGGKNGFWPVRIPDVKPEELRSHIGSEMAARLLDPANARTSEDGAVQHVLKGDDLKMGGEGMKGYYDSILPKSVMNLARMHDPSIRPAEPVMMSQDGQQYQGFHLPMTPELKNGILDKGYPAMKRGGSVGAALAATRRFTKDGAGAMLRLKS